MNKLPLILLALLAGGCCDHSDYAAYKQGYKKGDHDRMKALCLGAVESDKKKAWSVGYQAGYSAAKGELADKGAK